VGFFLGGVFVFLSENDLCSGWAVEEKSQFPKGPLRALGAEDFCLLSASLFQQVLTFPLRNHIRAKNVLYFLYLFPNNNCCFLSQDFLPDWLQSSPPRSSLLSIFLPLFFPFCACGSS